MIDDLKEFVGASQEEAVQRAASHFGVSGDQLEVRVLSEQLKISGLEGRVLILAGMKEQDLDLSPTGEFVNRILQKMGLSGRIRIEESQDEDGTIVVRLAGDAAQDLTRDDARVLGALSHIAARGAPKLVGDPDANARVEVGSGETPVDAKLEQLAKAKAEEVLKTGEATELEPMSSRDRWIVHNALKEVEGLRTESVGDGRDKRVRIEPA